MRLREARSKNASPCAAAGRASASRPSTRANRANTGACINRLPNAMLRAAAARHGLAYTPLPVNVPSRALECPVENDRRWPGTGLRSVQQRRRLPLGALRTGLVDGAGAARIGQLVLIQDSWGPVGRLPDVEVQVRRAPFGAVEPLDGRQHVRIETREAVVARMEAADVVPCIAKREPDDAGARLEGGHSIDHDVTADARSVEQRHDTVVRAMNEVLLEPLIAVRRTVVVDDDASGAHDAG